MIFNQKILLTGAAGFIGANIIRKLLHHNNIHALLKKSTNTWRINDILQKINMHFTPLDNLDKLRKTVKLIKPDIVIHLSAYGNSSRHLDPIKMIEVNILQTVNLILALEEIDYQCLINTGSSSEYGYKNKPMKETDNLIPNSFYSATKASATAFCKMHALSKKKPIVTIRPFSVYGPYEEKNRLIPTVINNIIDNKSIKLSDKMARHDFIFIDDLVDGYIKVINKINPSMYGVIINLGSGKQYSNNDIVKNISRILRAKPKVVSDENNRRVWDTNYWVANIALAKRLLQWKPKHTLIQGLEKTVRWYLNYDKRSKIYSQVTL